MLRRVAAGLTGGQQRHTFHHNPVPNRPATELFRAAIRLRLTEALHGICHTN
jgi:hypothetical protein